MYVWLFRRRAPFVPLGNIYNEVVVQTASVVRQLPWSIEAFFYLRGGAVDDVRAFHANFLSAYGLGAGGEVGRSVPLLQLDFGRQEAPFSLDPEFSRRAMG